MIGSLFLLFVLTGKKSCWQIFANDSFLLVSPCQTRIFANSLQKRNPWFHVWPLVKICDEPMPLKSQKGLIFSPFSYVWCRKRTDIAMHILCPSRERRHHRRRPFGTGPENLWCIQRYNPVWMFFDPKIRAEGIKDQHSSWFRFYVLDSSFQTYDFHFWFPFLYLTSFRSEQIQSRDISEHDSLFNASDLQLIEIQSPGFWATLR